MAVTRCPALPLCARPKNEYPTLALGCLSSGDLGLQVGFNAGVCACAAQLGLCSHGDGCEGL